MTPAKKTVLVVEDDADTVTYFSTLLKDNGYEVVTAETGEEALAKVKASPPDLITLDINMPPTDYGSGVKFYRDMKESDEWKGIPIIIVTGLKPDFEKFISTRRKVPPPEGYISKPIDREDFLTKVAKHLGS